MNGLGIVDFLFTAVGPGEGTEERASLKREFKEWMTTGAERDTEEGEGVTMGTGDYKCERVATLFKDFCEGMAGFDSGKGLVSLGLLDRWVSWTAKDRPLLYRKLKCSENGVAYALKDMKGASLADDDDDGFEVLISHKRAQSIVIHPYYTSTHATLHIHRCHDTHIYVLGPLRNLTLSHCRGTTVAVGAVSESLTLNRCDRVSVSGACRRVVVKGCEDSKVNVWVETKPMFVDECGGRKSKGVTLAPCNIWYNGMKVHLEEAGLGGKSNMWDQPVVVWDVVEPAVGDVELSGGGKGETAETETPGKHAFSLLPPTSFFCNELPFDFPSLDAVPLTAPAADGTSSPSRLTSTPNPLPLPPAYAARTSSYENHALRARHIVESATAADPATKAEFQRKIETEFHAWMRKTGRIGEVCSLVAAGRDMDKMRQIVESKGPRDDNNNTEDDDDELVMMDIEEPQHSENGKLRIGNVTVF
ncbi:hypothetical protein HK104_002803 [Borealophlyctis nickersoniae]|nr:hypothetical protein HK104_002803 [Borealophlyctis nickersoniae]